MLVKHLQKGRIICAREKAVLGKLQEVEHLLAEALTLIEALGRVVCANNYHAQICGFEADVNVQQEILRASGHTDRCPCFSIFHARHCPNVVEKHHYVCAEITSSAGLPSGLTMSSSSVKTLITLSWVTIIPNLNQRLSHRRQTYAIF